MKFHLNSRNQRALFRSLTVLGGTFALGVSPLFAGNAPANLGAGLDVLYKSNVQKQEAAKGAAAKGAPGRSTPVLTDERQAEVDLLSSAMTDAQGRVLVQIHLNGDQALKSVVDGLGGNVEIVASTADYRNGLVEGWIRVEDAAAVAKVRGVSSVILQHRPVNNVGAVTQQGVNRHRVDQIPQFNGTGISIGAMSDSYDTATSATTHAAADVLSNDLPGTTNTAGNTTPVVVLQETGTGADEGRGMLQVIHDMVPKARLAFATANGGPLNFANNIKALAALPGFAYPPATQQGFKADIIVDDISYLNEPMFSDGIITQAVDAVNAAGVHYFSSAGNRPSTNGYFSNFRPAGDSAAAAAASGINLAGVSQALYAGGFHNFRTDGTVDIAQTLVRTAGSGNSNRLVFQWDDPFDAISPGTQVFTQHAVFAGTTQNFTPVPLVAGVPSRVTAIADAGSLFDAIVTVLDPSNNVVIGPIDTGTDETLFFTPTVTGNYTVRIDAFGGTVGGYTVSAFSNSKPLLTTDFNVLFFRADTGAFIPAGITAGFGGNNFGTNEPLELGNVPFPTGQSQIQVVFARANNPVGPAASRLRYVIFDSGSATTNPAEYISYQYPVTFGHNCARDGHGVAAYSAFRPNIPEGFTSPGPMINLFDNAGNRLAAPEIREKPDLAAMDGSNTTFFVSDSANDADTFPNFFGTSCAAPNAASCAALVLQAKGGPGSVTPRQMKKILQSTTFPHDLDPYLAKAQVRTPGGKLTINVNADSSNSSGGQAAIGAAFDRTVVSVNYVGASSIKTLTFDLSGGNTTGGNDTGASFPGLVWDTRGVGSGGLPFVLGNLTGLAASDIVATNPPASQAPAPSLAGHFYQMTLTFTDNAFTGGKSFTFNSDRDEQRNASLTSPATVGGNSADLWGANVLIPAGTIAPGGATISGTMQDGTPFSGTFLNRIGAGYSPLDGYGFINAQAAVAAPLPPP